MKTTITDFKKPIKEKLNDYEFNTNIPVNKEGQFNLKKTEERKIKVNDVLELGILQAKTEGYTTKADLICIGMKRALRIIYMVERTPKLKELYNLIIDKNTKKGLLYEIGKELKKLK